MNGRIENNSQKKCDKNITLMNKKIENILGLPAQNGFP